MNYFGKLYGKVGPRSYIPLIMTSDDVDKLERNLAACRSALEKTCNACDWPTPDSNLRQIIKESRETLELTKP